MPKSTPDFDSSELELHARLSSHVSTCPPLDVLLASEQDALPPELAGPARAHVARCELCKALLADMARLPEAPFSQAQQEKIAASLPAVAGRAPRWSVAEGLLALAATVLLMAGLFFFAHRGSGGNRVELARVERAPVLMPSPLKELHFTPLAPPAGAAALLTRGSVSQDEPSNEELLPAFKAYRHADYTDAAKQLESLANRFASSQLILLYLGVSQLALHQDQQAVRTLQRAHEANQRYDADAVQWYSAVAASRVHPADAAPLLGPLCANKASAYSAQSCAVLGTAGPHE